LKFTGHGIWSFVKSLTSRNSKRTGLVLWRSLTSRSDFMINFFSMACLVLSSFDAKNQAVLVKAGQVHEALWVAQSELGMDVSTLREKFDGLYVDYQEAMRFANVGQFLKDVGEVCEEESFVVMGDKAFLKAEGKLDKVLTDLESILVELKERVEAR